MTRSITFELSADTVQGCRAAREGGAHRIELGSALSQDGLTPSHALIRAAIEQSGLPVHVLLRPRTGDFLYTAEEFSLMREDLLHARLLGASGFALGILRADATVDLERTRELVELASPLEVTFHRAFDLTPSLDQALEEVIATGCRRVLTSGGERDVVAGVDTLARLAKRSAGRIDIAAGGSLRIHNAGLIARQTGILHFHASMRREGRLSAHSQKDILHSSSVPSSWIDSAEISALLQELRKT